MPRHAGLSLPLFSAISTKSWGIGEIGDAPLLGEWMAAARFDRLMILPIGTMAPGQSSPYSAVSAMAIDPIFISVERLDDFLRAGGREALSADARHALDLAQVSPDVRYDLVRRAKGEALDLAFSRFAREEWTALTTGAAALAGYIARERSWLDDYALFQALATAMGTTDWRRWPAGVRDREPRALDEARRQCAREVLRHQYLQWIAQSQWQDARSSLHALGITVVGDLPFVVGADSSDVWARPHEFLLNVAVGTPPDAFSETGQNWHLPAYHWDVIARADFEWIHQRARRMAALYDGFRVDHLVGFYRTYGRPEHGEPFFMPADEGAQLWQGERVLEIFRGSGAEIIAEDLGTVPDFVRASLARLSVPGCKVLRWERAWHTDGQPFIPTEFYPAISVALTGTHDTEPLAMWWDELHVDDRIAFLRLPGMAERGFSDPTQRWSDALRDAFLEVSYRAGSNDLFLPIQDVFGWRDRINVPGTVGESNWSWRLAVRVDQLMNSPESVERARFCRNLATSTGRTLKNGAMGQWVNEQIRE